MRGLRSRAGARRAWSRAASSPPAQGGCAALLVGSFLLTPSSPTLQRAHRFGHVLRAREEAQAHEVLEAAHREQPIEVRRVAPILRHTIIIIIIIITTTTTIVNITTTCSPSSAPRDEPRDRDCNRPTRARTPALNIRSHARFFPGMDADAHRRRQIRCFTIRSSFCEAGAGLLPTRTITTRTCGRTEAPNGLRASREEPTPSNGNGGGRDGAIAPSAAPAVGRASSRSP